MAKQNGYIESDRSIERKQSMTKLTRWEMETTINFNAEEKTAVLYTRDKAVMRRLDKLTADFPDIYKCVRETDIDKTYEFPKKYAIPKRPRVLTDEQRDAMRERLARARDNRADDGLDDGMDDEEQDEELL